jgi:glycosyltransferase involved in cell wall biosynthesis
VCHVAYTFFENDNRVLRYAEALKERGDNVEVVALRRSHETRSGAFRGIPLTRIQRRSVTEKAPLIYLLKTFGFFIHAAALLAVRHLRNPYDVIHVHNVPDFLVFAALVPKLLGAHVILDIHDALPELYAGKFGNRTSSPIDKCLRLIERLSCLFADHVFIANDIWREKLIRRALPRSKCTTVLNYPDLRLFRPIAASGPPEDARFVMLYPGSLNRHQGVDLAIKALPLVKPDVPQAELHIYGEGAGLNDLVRLASELGVSDSVHFHAPVPIDQISAVMAAADVGIEPKRSEGFSDEALSTKILEFMACGVPVVVSKTTAHKHYFDERVVRFFAPGDAPALANAVVRVYADRVARSDWTTSAREFAATFNWEARASEYFHVLSLLTTRPLRGAR